MSDKKFEPRKPDFKGFVVKADGKADFTKPYSAVWFNDNDNKPSKPFTMVNNGTPKKIRFFSYEEVEQAQQDYEEAKKIVQAKRGQGNTTTPFE